LFIGPAERQNVFVCHVEDKVPRLGRPMAARVEAGRGKPSDTQGIEFFAQLAVT